MNLIEDVKDIHTMNITEIKKIQINEKTSSTYELKDLVLLKWAILSKEIYRSKAIPITISSLFCGNGKADPQIHMEFQRALNGQNNLRKEHRWKTLISRFQKLTKATMNKTVWYWHKNRHIHQWNRIRSQEISQTYMAK